MEYALLGTLFPEAGFRWDGIFNPWSVGLGAKFGAVRVDLASSSAGDFGQIFRATITYDFGYEALKPVPTALPTPVPRPLAVATPEAPTLSAPQNAGLSKLSSNPEPFKSGGTYIFFDLAQPADIAISVFAGRENVRTIKVGIVNAGPNQAYFDGRDDAGRPLPPGSYAYGIKAGSGSNEQILYGNFNRVK
jgi:hypothetical protein